MLTVQDDGDGIAPRQKPNLRALHPASTRPAAGRRGHGLGLAIAMREWLGRAPSRLRGRQPRGARFVMRLPLGLSAQTPRHSRRPCGRCCFLVVWSVASSRRAACPPAPSPAAPCRLAVQVPHQHVATVVAREVVSARVRLGH
ncbi:ATP-binding protein [Nonomuraea dietziae]|uniref:ATP-binding protein n=1 Tax=Nonomuraea dietziae TaxID=65515 RepID=UPI003CD0663B